MSLRVRVLLATMLGAACLLALLPDRSGFAGMALDEGDLGAAQAVADDGTPDSAAPPALLRARARLREALGDLDGSIAALSILQAGAPADLKVAHTLAAQLRAVGDLAKAQALLMSLPPEALTQGERAQLAVELARDDPEAERLYLTRLHRDGLAVAGQLARLGMVEAAAGRDVAALPVLRAADDQHPAGLLRERLTLLDILLAQDRRPEARARADRWQGLMPGPEVSDALEQVFAARGLARSVPDDLPTEDVPGLRCSRPVRSWAIQLQSIVPADLHRASADVLIIDATDGIPGLTLPAETINLLKYRPDRSRRLLLAYLSIGQAENYREYWQAEWAQSPPDWLIAPDPRWPGNFDVRFWQADWQALIFGGPDALLDGLLKAGFDGVMLDGVDAYERHMDERPDGAALMAQFVADIAQSARRTDPEFIVLPLNGHGLLDQPAFRGAIDGLVQEDLYFGRFGDGAENPPDGVDWTLDRLRPARGLGLPVLLLEYLDGDAARATAAQRAQADGLQPSFGSRQLDRISEPWPVPVPVASFADGAACGGQGISPSE